MLKMQIKCKKHVMTNMLLHVKNTLLFRQIYFALFVRPSHRCPPIYIFVLYLWKRVVEKTLLVLVLITFCQIFTLNKSGTYLTEKEKGGQTHFKL